MVYRDCYINSSAWVLRCSFLTGWANARASSGGTSKMSDFHAFLFIVSKQNFYFTPTLGSQQAYHFQLTEEVVPDTD